MHRSAIQTPLGWLNIETSDWAVLSVYFTPHPHSVDSDHPLVISLKQQLEAYFSGNEMEFRLPVEPPGTAFQRAVWDEVSAIKPACTLSYSALSRRCGRETSPRAVAAAVAANPVALLIPCHRIIGSNGRLTGYAWGLERKQWLLDHEKKSGQLKLF